jgi:hypothetical protein
LGFSFLGCRGGLLRAAGKRKGAREDAGHPAERSHMHGL